VIACNTASTIALAQLRETFKVPFVGTVPAIKPAAAQSKSHIIGVLATPGTVRREYTHTLIHDFASHCHVTLHGAPKLAEIAERKLKGVPVDLDELKAEITPVFVEEGGKPRLHALSAARRRIPPARAMAGRMDRPGARDRAPRRPVARGQFRSRVASRSAGCRARFLHQRARTRSPPARDA